MTYRQSQIKIFIEGILNLPFLIFGKILGVLICKKVRKKYFLFFSSADIGGAPKVNLDILQLLPIGDAVIIFSKRPKNAGFQYRFMETKVQIVDLSKFVDHKIIHFMNVIFRGIISVWINSSEKPIVFGGECMYFYKIIPHVKESAKVIELSHMDTWLNYNQCFIPIIDVRIVSTPKLKREMELQYFKNRISKDFLKRIVCIDNWVELPDQIQLSESRGSLKILFVGRGAPQKRVHLISQIAEYFIDNQDNVEFTFIGDVRNIVSKKVIGKSRIIEYVSDQLELKRFYDESDVLILTSSYEGLPIVIMEMMARGKIVISTAVDGIPDYIEDKINGFLIKEIVHEGRVVAEGIEIIKEILHEKFDLKSIGQNARKTAELKFRKNLFVESYKKVLIN